MTRLIHISKSQLFQSNIDIIKIFGSKLKQNCIKYDSKRSIYKTIIGHILYISIGDMFPLNYEGLVDKFMSAQPLYRDIY